MENRAPRSGLGRPDTDRPERMYYLPDGPWRPIIARDATEESLIASRHEACCKIPTTSCPCPVCGNAGRKVTALTLDHHVPKELRAAIGDEATFCLNPACEVVYCNPGGFVVRKGRTVLPVTIKDAGDQVPVCYCFDFKRGDVRRDLTERGKTGIPDQIRKGVAEGRCDCERRNPQGACCLGNVAAAIKEIKGQPHLKPS